MKQNISGRTIIFGDIHGCYREWQDLLEKTEAGPKDLLFSVGDLVCKGPSTKKTLDKAMQMQNLFCVLGNHEYELLRAWRGGELDRLPKAYQHDAIRDLGGDVDRYMHFLEAWPYFMERPDFILVHAGIRPSEPLAKQDPEDLVSIRETEPGVPWHETYQGKKLIVHGHWARQGLVVRENVIGLDTGCVYGGELSAVILPERKIVSVPAREVYVPIRK